MTSASTKDTDPIVVTSKPGVRSLESYLFGDREHPVVALTRSAATGEPVLAAGAIRAIVGPGARIYYIPGEHLLGRLQSVLGRTLALPQGAARIFWPGLSTRSDPGDHPLVLALADESQRDTLAEFARQFDLSRPEVRREIRLIEDARTLLEHRLAQAIEQDRTAEQRLRDAQVERADGAKGWRCNLKRNAPGGPRPHYWKRPDGTVEFAGVGNHDELGTTDEP